MRSERVSRQLARTAFEAKLTGDKIVLIAGPRQAGKTTLARDRLRSRGCSSLYFNWDDQRVRRSFREDPHFFEAPARQVRRKQPWIAFDEIHKAPRWRDMLKGWFDVFHDEFRFLVTGSARLDLLRRGGDSLVGRYFLFHLFPLSLNELLGRNAAVRPPAWLAGETSDGGDGRRRSVRWPSSAASQEAFSLLFRRGPFPEPLLKDSDRFSRRWADDYLALLLRQDIRDLTRISEIERLEALLEVLPDAICSPISYSSLARDLEVAHTSVRRWLEALRRLYLLFAVRPYARRSRRALRRRPKWYFLDWSHVPVRAARLQNLVASSLYQACQTWRDAGYGRYQLCYLRTLDKKEIDFVVTVDGEPRAAVEVKESELRPSPSLRRRAEYLGPGVVGIQVVATPDIARRVEPGLWVISADRLLGSLH